MWEIAGYCVVRDSSAVCCGRTACSTNSQTTYYCMQAKDQRWKTFVHQVPTKASSGTIAQQRGGSNKQSGALQAHIRMHGKTAKVFG